MVAKSLRVKIKKIDGFFKTHNGIRCLALLGYVWFDYVIILINSVSNKNKNCYCYIKCLEKGSYKDKSNTEFF